MDSLQRLKLPAKASVDLHSHLFMKKGLGWMFRGGFFGKLKATNWKTRFSQQTNPESLEKSGNHIVVAALYAHPLLNVSLKESIRNQIIQAEEFVKKYQNWIIAKTAQEAVRALLENKKVLILSLEGASGILETEKDIEEFIDQKGIRIITLLHFISDEIGGAAFLKEPAALVSPLSFIRHRAKNLLHRDKHWDVDYKNNPIRLNDRGLTEHGKKLVSNLLKRKVWIDLSHSSDAVQEDLIVVLKQHGQPLLYTHTALRRYHGAERGISDKQLEEVKKSQGIVGILPSEWMLARTPVNGINSFLMHYKEMIGCLGHPKYVSIGSDFNGCIDHIKPTSDTKTTLDHRGFWNIGQTGEFWDIVLEQAKKYYTSNKEFVLSDTVLHFLQAWQQVG